MFSLLMFCVVLFYGPTKANVNSPNYADRSVLPRKRVNAFLHPAALDYSRRDKIS